jgi:hypothetical protein
MTSDTAQNDDARVAETVSGDPWDRIQVGAQVLAIAPNEPGWWDAEVIGLHEKGSMITLKWVGFDDLPKFMVSRYSVALKRPSGEK